MKTSIGAISSGTISSKTALAAFMINNIEKGTEFFKGLKYGLLINKNTSFNATVGVVEGLTAALEFRAYIEGIKSALPNPQEKITEPLTALGSKLAALNQSYTHAFHEQEQRLASITEQTNNHFKEITEESQKYFDDKDRRCAELEALYTEKLRLQAPAEYWLELEREYSHKGGWWLAASIVFALLIIAALIAVITFLPNMFTDDSHWFDIFKNSAIVTVVASVAIYMLHLFVKLATSSIHLSRDAKERSKLRILSASSSISSKANAFILFLTLV